MEGVDAGEPVGAVVEAVRGAWGGWRGGGVGGDPRSAVIGFAGFAEG